MRVSVAAKLAYDLTSPKPRISVLERRIEERVCLLALCLFLLLSYVLEVRVSFGWFGNQISANHFLSLMRCVLVAVVILFRDRCCFWTRLSHAQLVDPPTAIAAIEQAGNALDSLE